MSEYPPASLPLAQVLHTIDSDQGRLEWCQLPSGEQYFRRGGETKPTNWMASHHPDLTLHPFSETNGYEELDCNLVFLNQNGLTLLENNPKAFVWRRVGVFSVPTYPLPLVDREDPLKIRELSDQIRLLNFKRALSQLSDLPFVVKTLNNVSEQFTAQSDQAIRSLDYLLTKLLERSLEGEVGSASAQVMSHKLTDCNHLLTLVREVLSYKEEIEKCTYYIQQKLRPLHLIVEQLQS